MPRRTAYEVLLRVERDAAYSHIALSAALEASGLKPRDRALVTELVYGVLTWRRALDRVLGEHLHRGLDSLDLELTTILRLGLYQLWFLDRIPSHAAVNEAVEAARAHDPSRAGIVNAVLRKLSGAERVWWSEKLRGTSPARFIGQRYSTSSWIARCLVEVYSERAEAVADAYTKRAPTWARAASEPEGLDGALEAHPEVPGAWRVADFDDRVRAALDAGALTIQDLGSQLIGAMCGEVEGLRVLDACAGLGGKSLHLLDAGVGELVSVDPGGSKLAALIRSAEVRAQSERLRTVTGGLEEVAGDLGAFDVVLVDAPCSGLGTMRRHPETRWRRGGEEVASLTAIQRSILAAAAELVRPGGVLVYSVCTFTPSEGLGQVDAFLEGRDDFARAPVPGAPDWLSAHLDARGDLSLNTAEHGTDGFYCARMRRAP